MSIRYSSPYRYLHSIILSLALTSSLLAAEGDSEETLAERVVDNLLERENYMRYGEHGLHYAEACAAIGALRFCELAGDEENFARLKRRYEVLLEPGTDLISRTPHVDFSVIGAIPLQVYLAAGGERYLGFGLDFAERQWEDPRPDGLTRETRWWVDDIYMVGMLQMQAYRATGKELYADRTARFVASYLERLQQDNGLFHHGPDAPLFWGRGNGWVASGVAEALCDLPAEHPLHASILERYRRMMEALLPLQAESGLWRQLLDYPDSWEETSCTAMFAYAMQTGVNRGWLEAAVYQPAIDTAWQALLERTDEDGALEAICVGTGQSQDPQYYLDRPAHTGDFHGHAPLLWLAVERIRAADHSPAILEQIDVAPVWSVHVTGEPGLLTVDDYQYVIYYDAQRFFTIAQRKLDSAGWSYHQFPVQMGWASGSHAKISMEIDRLGYLHLSCYRRDLLASPKPPPKAIYYRSKAPHSIKAFEQSYMISPEEHPHYPNYYKIDDELFFSFRDGVSGRGNQMLNRYDIDQRNWVREFDTPLTDGQGKRNAYLYNFGVPYPGPDGRFHLYWVWRETGNHATNNSLSYARTVGRDLSQWETVAGQSVTPPFTIENRELLVDGSPPGGGLSNVLFRLGLDSQNQAVVSYHKFDPEGRSQIYVGRVKEGEWHIVQITDWEYVWGKSYSGGGALGIRDHIRMGSIEVGEPGELTHYVWNGDDGGSVVVLDESSLEPVRQEVPPAPLAWREQLAQPESDFQVPAIPELRRSGGPMQVQIIEDKGGVKGTSTEYYLRWEHAGNNRDRAVPKPWPEPTMLRLYKIQTR